MTRTCPLCDVMPLMMFSSPNNEIPCVLSLFFGFFLECLYDLGTDVRFGGLGVGGVGGVGSFGFWIVAPY
jgi:hypothetical protein